MCVKAKQNLNTEIADNESHVVDSPCFKPVRLLASLFALAVVAPSISNQAMAQDRAHRTAAAGGVTLGDPSDGVADRAYVTAPPNYRYVVMKSPGSFVDCGASVEVRTVDAAGRDLAGLSCAVTLTETIVIPAAAQSARLIVHY